jgi:NAD(P)-dependent dehydrogenase (short-subunit alcohol dehydrogenase family)
MTRIDGSTALVTGGQRGLGEAFVEALPRGGATKVYATARKPTPSRDLAWRRWTSTSPTRTP